MPPESEVTRLFCQRSHIHAHHGKMLAVTSENVSDAVLSESTHTPPPCKPRFVRDPRMRERTGGGGEQETGQGKANPVGSPGKITFYVSTPNSI